MPPKSVENLKVYQKAVAGADAIFAITKRPAFNRDPELRQQLRTSSGRIQTKGHLRRALGYGFISQDEYQTHWDMYDELAAMLTGLRNYLDPNGQDR